MTKATTTRTTERRSQRFLRSLCVLWASACVCACARPNAPAAAATRAAAPPSALHRGPLGDFVPAAGLRWIVLAKPREILADPQLGPAILRVISSRRLDAFAEASGVDLRQVPHAAVAGFPYATLYLAEVQGDTANAAREHFKERLVTGAVTKRARPDLLRVTGVIGKTPETLLTIDNRVLAVAVGDPLPAKIAEAYAQERLKSSPSALRGSALKTLPDLIASNAAVLMAPGPFADEWQRAAGGLLESTVAVGIALRAVGDGKLAATICLSGAWQESADTAARQLATAWTSFAQSSAGHLFTLNPIADVSASPELLTLHVELQLEPLLQGLKAALMSDITGLLQLPSSTENSAPDAAPRVDP